MKSNKPDKLSLHKQHEHVPYYFVKADITKYHKLGGFSNRDILSHNSGG